MCKHAFVIKEDKTYYDKNLKCRVRIETIACIFCGRKETERSIYMDPPRRKLPRFNW
nr:MAG TPA: Churchill protein [Caudoviricetes sp.]